MYNYIPLLFAGAARLIIKGISERRNQVADAAMAEDIRRSAAAARLSPPDPRRAQETALYGDEPRRLSIGLLAKLAKADGVVSKEEVGVVEGIFAEVGAVGEVRQLAITIFQAAKDGPLSFEEVLELFAQHSRQSEADRHDLIVMLLRLAHANRRDLSAQAGDLIQTACRTLDRDYQEYLGGFRAWRQAVDAAAQAEAEKRKLAYEILGCTPADGDEHLRHRYRQLVRDFHPDTIAGKGLSPEFVRFAEEKFKEIHEAYELIVDHRR